LEGVKNKLAQYGYNRDGKKGKMQIVIGLLCDQEGIPVSIQVFEGNTADTKTVSDQIKKIANRFGAESVVMVGDRGMLKSEQRTELEKEGFHYITAISNAQVKTLIKKDTLQMSLFDINLQETEHEGQRYICRKNPIRAQEIRKTRESKKETIEAFIKEQNKYLSEHPKAKEETALKKIQEKIEQFKISWLSIRINEDNTRHILLSEDSEKKEEISELDGCYCLITDVKKEVMDTTHIHARYKDLAHVELAFRTSKMDFLEIRPLFVRKEKRTKGHALIVMLAYRIVQELKKLWKNIDMTVEEGIKALCSLCEITVSVNKKTEFIQIPQPRPSLQTLLKALHINIPSSFPLKM
jgi:transposase